MKDKFDGNPEIIAAADRLKLAFASPVRGTLIPWAQIEALIGRHRDDRGGWTIINRFRKWLRREHRIVTLPEYSVGLRLLTHEETATEVPALRQKKAYRQVNRCLREIACVDAGELKEHQRKLLFWQRARLKDQRLEIGRSRRRLAEMVKPSETHPLRKKAAV